MTPAELPYLDAAGRAFGLCERLGGVTRTVVASDDGLPLASFSAGPADAPPVVLVNPIGISFLLLAPLLRSLARDHRVVTWESRLLPNWSPGDDDGDSGLAAQLGDLDCVLGAHAIGRPHLVAYCSGSGLALRALADGRVEATSLTLVSPSLHGAGGETTLYQAQILPLWPKVARQGLRGAALVRRLLAAAERAPTGPLAAELDAINNLPFASDERALTFARLLGPWIEADLAGCLPRVATPTLIVHTADDALIHVDGSYHAQRALPAAELVVHAEGGHYAVCTRTVVHEAVRAHLARWREAGQ